jgi:glucose/arabinose dehydrogenase
MNKKLLLVLFLTAVSTTQGQTGPAPRATACTAGLELPDGFCATLFAEGVNGARHLVVAPNGDVFVNTQSRGEAGGGIVALRDTDRDGKADVKEHFGSGVGTGIALEGNNLYATSGNSIVRYRIASGSLTPAGKPDTIVTGLPMSGSHHSHNFVLQDGSLFVNIGSASTACQVRDRQSQSEGYDPCTELNTRAGVWEFDANRLHQEESNGRRFATGLRNSVALSRTADGDLYATVHGRDQLHDNWPSLFTAEKSAENPGEELVQITRGADYGWPYCYYDVDRHALVLAPEYGGDGTKTARCADKTAPLMAFPGHWAPNGMMFYTGTQFPASYRGGAFIAFHGSWNRAPLPQAGYRVVFVPFRAGKPAGSWTTFADGFHPNPGTSRAARGTRRPTGVAQSPDGSLFISDDTGGTIWKITYRGSSR